MLKVEDAQIVSSASAGIAQSVAALIGKGSLYHAYHPYTEKSNSEIILPKGHNVDYGTPVEVMVAQGGGQSGSWLRQHVQSRTRGNDDFRKTAAILYIKSHHTVQKYADGGRSGQSGATPQGAANC